MDSDSNRKIRYAVIGAGNIAQVAVLPAFAHAENSELVAVISGDAEKREELSKKYELELSGDYPDLEKILAAGNIDALYVATPNALHKEHVLRAAAARVNVLCEKPLATNVADCEEMARACEKARVLLMIAYRLHFEDATLRALELVKSGKIGDPRVFESVFGHVVRPGDIRERQELGGGAALDLGVYCVNAARNLFRDEPVLAFALAQNHDGVDETTTAILQFPRGRVAQFTVSNAVAGVSSYRVVGTDGDLRVEPGYSYDEGLEHYLTIDGSTEHETFGRRDQFAPELEYFSRCIMEGHPPEPSVEEAICDLRVIEAILQSAETGKPVPLAPRQRSQRPSLEQASKRPAVAKQKPINAPSPSLK
jgi:predicted dehydrogenase